MQVIRNAKLWCDVESAKQAKELSGKWDYNLVPGFTASKILWLKENEPENFEKLAKVLLPHDYINWYLTGEYAAEVGQLCAPDLAYKCDVFRHMNISGIVPCQSHIMLRCLTAVRLHVDFTLSTI